MKKSLSYTVTIIAIVIFSSCKSYTIPVDSLRQQLQGIDPSKCTLILPGDVFSKATYRINGIRVIHCEDNDGNKHELAGGSSIEVRFTYGSDNRRMSGYFDTVFLTDSTVSFVRSRYM